MVHVNSTRVGGGGTAGPRTMLRALPTPKPKVDEPIPSLKAVKVPRRCPVELPSALVIEPADARFSQILVLHWANSVQPVAKLPVTRIDGATRSGSSDPEMTSASTSVPAAKTVPMAATAM